MSGLHKQNFSNYFLKNGLTRILFGLVNYSTTIGSYFFYQEIIQHYQIPGTPKQFAIVFDAIPSGVSVIQELYV